MDVKFARRIRNLYREHVPGQESNAYLGRDTLEGKDLSGIKQLSGSLFCDLINLMATQKDESCV